MKLSFSFTIFKKIILFFKKTILIIKRTCSWCQKNTNYKKKKTINPQALGVLLCYNDADILEDAIKALLENEHHIVAWDHGSNDETSEVLDKYERHLLEKRHIPRNFDFYELYPTMSQHLIKSYVSNYDWISWPDQDEILEGPSRSKRYYDFITDAFNSPFDWIQFNNFNYWFTNQDSQTITSPVQRIRHYCLFPDCAPRIRSWRATSTNIRKFNHNPPNGKQFPEYFNLRHYPMRTQKQMEKRLNKDRANLQRGEANFHYNHMNKVQEKLFIEREQLHFDDGRSELNPEVIFNWRTIYGYGATPK